MDEHYHSVHGALQEALHVFIEMGLRKVASERTSVNLLEIGFGTGLNALLTAIKTTVPIQYFGLEAYPVPIEMALEMDYPALLSEADVGQIFKQIHAVSWEEYQTIVPQFELKKVAKKLEEVQFKEQFDLIYYDAFGPRAQPEMWDSNFFQKIFEATNPGGILVTYCAKGQVRRDLISAGFKVERLPGPPGKREMLRATK